MSPYDDVATAPSFSTSFGWLLHRVHRAWLDFAASGALCPGSAPLPCCSALYGDIAPHYVTIGRRVDAPVRHASSWDGLGRDVPA